MEKGNKLHKIAVSLQHLEESGLYDTDKYLCALVQQTAQLEYFYCHLVKQGNVQATYYRVKRRPCVHQLAYFNIGRGYPRELMDGHYCYIYKDFGSKMLVIPCVSLKPTSGAPGFLETDIEITMQGTHSCVRLLLSDLRSVDLQRLDLRKPFRRVTTPRSDIRAFVRSRLA